MKSRLTIILFAVTALFSTAAQSADNENKNAEKVIAVLKTLDIDHPYLTETANYIDERTTDGYFYFADEEVAGFQMQLRYDTHSMRSENLQLNITEKGSNYNLTGSSEGVMFRYKLNF
jgi:hypothetical protein